MHETMLTLRRKGIEIIMERSELGEGVVNPTWTSYAYREKQCVLSTWYRAKNSIQFSLVFLLTIMLR